MSIRLSVEWRERLASPLTWHYAGAVVLLVLSVTLAIRFGLDLADTSSSRIDALANKQIELKALDMQTAPLRGMDKRVEQTREQMRDFYLKRIPPNYSSIATRIGELQVKAGVRLSRVNYTQGKPGSELTEISMDAGIVGDYPQIMRFVNTLERDETFFVIQSVSLTGQQGGLVNLRLRVSTWLRPADAAASGLPPTPEPGAAPANPPVAGREGL
jgi:Tfp pilus assembly protein PilO